MTWPSTGKVALVNPADLAMLEESHDFLERAGTLESLSLSATVLKALHAEDRPHTSACVEDPKEIAAILDL